MVPNQQRFRVTVHIPPADHGRAGDKWPCQGDVPSDVRHPRLGRRSDPEADSISGFLPMAASTGMRQPESRRAPKSPPGKEAPAPAALKPGGHPCKCDVGAFHARYG